MRALARDLGRALKCLGYVASLRRTAVGPFRENTAVTLDALQLIATVLLALTVMAAAERLLGTARTVIAFLGYIGGLFGPVQGLSGVYTSVRKASVSLDEIFGILDVQEHLGDSPDAVDLTQVRGEVTFEDVHFRY